MNYAKYNKYRLKLMEGAGGRTNVILLYTSKEIAELIMKSLVNSSVTSITDGTFYKTSTKSKDYHILYKNIIDEHTSPNDGTLMHVYEITDAEYKIKYPNDENLKIDARSEIYVLRTNDLRDHKNPKVDTVIIFEIATGMTKNTVKKYSFNETEIGPDDFIEGRFIYIMQKNDVDKIVNLAKSCEEDSKCIKFTTISTMTLNISFQMVSEGGHLGTNGSIQSNIKESLYNHELHMLLYKYSNVKITDPNASLDLTSFDEDFLCKYIISHTNRHHKTQYDTILMIDFYNSKTHPTLKNKIAFNKSYPVTDLVTTEHDFFSGKMILFTTADKATEINALKTCTTNCLTPSKIVEIMGKSGIKKMQKSIYLTKNKTTGKYANSANFTLAKLIPSIDMPPVVTADTYKTLNIDVLSKYLLYLFNNYKYKGRFKLKNVNAKKIQKGKGGKRSAPSLPKSYNTVIIIDIYSPLYTINKNKNEIKHSQTYPLESIKKSELLFGNYVYHVPNNTPNDQLYTGNSSYNAFVANSSVTKYIELLAGIDKPKNKKITIQIDNKLLSAADGSISQVPDIIDLSPLAYAFTSVNKKFPTMKSTLVDYSNTIKVGILRKIINNQSINRSIAIKRTIDNKLSEAKQFSNKRSSIIYSPEDLTIIDEIYHKNTTNDVKFAIEAVLTEKMNAIVSARATKKTKSVSSEEDYEEYYEEDYDDYYDDDDENDDYIDN